MSFLEGLYGVSAPAIDVEARRRAAINAVGWAPPGDLTATTAAAYYASLPSYKRGGREAAQMVAMGFNWDEVFALFDQTHAPVGQSDALRAAMGRNPKAASVVAPGPVVDWGQNLAPYVPPVPVVQSLPDGWGRDENGALFYVGNQSVATYAADSIEARTAVAYERGEDVRPPDAVVIVEVAAARAPEPLAAPADTFHPNKRIVEQVTMAAPPVLVDVPAPIEAPPVNPNKRVLEQADLAPAPVGAPQPETIVRKIAELEPDVTRIREPVITTYVPVVEQINRTVIDAGKSPDIFQTLFGNAPVVIASPDAAASPGPEIHAGVNWSAALLAVGALGAFAYARKRKLI